MRLQSHSETGEPSRIMKKGTFILVSVFVLLVPFCFTDTLCVADAESAISGREMGQLAPPGQYQRAPLPPIEKTIPPPPLPLPPVPLVPENRGAINPRTGERYLPSGKGVFNPRTGEYYPPSGNGYINPRTGEYFPPVDQNRQNNRTVPVCTGGGFPQARRKGRGSSDGFFSSVGAGVRSLGQGENR